MNQVLVWLMVGKISLMLQEEIGSLELVHLVGIVLQKKYL